ncbi:MAG: hypothetical protein HKO65_14130 [Gemmatimonadetes bacterium]|nr:hypothetical protein [Gemmatimonadota bacterium]NNM06224.1 hypothetical protein [Gemmatimonadota bacterium]
MRRRTFAIPLLAILAVSACSDSSPTGVDEGLDEAAFALVAEAALEVNDQQGTPLPSLENLLRRTFEAIRANDGHADGVRFLKAGQPLKAIIVVLGPGVAVESLRGVRNALEQLHARIGDRPIPDRVRKTIHRARQTLQRGVAAMEAGDPVAALGAALVSAELIRSLSPRYRARRAIQHASRAFEAARKAAGDAPDPTTVGALRNAHRFLGGAIEAFKGKKYREAYGLARNSLEISQEVLKALSG